MPAVKLTTQSCPVSLAQLVPPSLLVGLCCVLGQPEAPLAHSTSQLPARPSGEAPFMNLEDLPLVRLSTASQPPGAIIAGRPSTNRDPRHLTGSASGRTAHAKCVLCNQDTLASCTRCPPPSHWLCTACQTGQSACFIDQARDYEWSQAISSVVIAVERRQAPVSGYTLRLRQIHWNAFIRTCLPQGALSQNYFGATVGNPFLSGTLTAAATDVARTSHDQVIHDMRAQLHTHGRPSSIPPTPDTRRIRLEWLAALESLDETQPQHNHDHMLWWRTRRNDPEEPELQRLAARMPHARVAIATRAARTQDQNLRAAYTLHRPPPQPTLRGTCSWCGSSAANFCRTCSAPAEYRGALCHPCEDDFSECRACRGLTMARDVQPACLGA